MNNTTSNLVRLLVVDDSALYRKFVSKVLAADPGIEVVGTACNGKVALEKIDLLKPDLLTLDLEMPELDGLGVLRRLQQDQSPVGAIVLSALSAEGATATTKALDAGAFDFALKPAGASPEASIAELEKHLIPKVHAFSEARARRSLQPKTLNVETPPTSQFEVPPPVVRGIRPPQIVVIGVSTGGPKALCQLIPSLPSDFPVPIAIVQHMPPVFTKSLADELDRQSKLTVVEAEHGQKLHAGTVSLAPGGKQMKLKRSAGSPSIVITDDPPERNCKPSVDYLFRSVADLYGGECLAAILTGMGDDGLLGCKLLKRRGATVIAQEEASCVVYGMPRQVVEHQLADFVLPLEKIGAEMLQLVGREAATCR